MIIQFSEVVEGFLCTLLENALRLCHHLKCSLSFLSLVVVAKVVRCHFVSVIARIQSFTSMILPLHALLSVSFATFALAPQGSSCADES